MVCSGGRGIRESGLACPGAISACIRKSKQDVAFMAIRI